MANHTQSHDTAARGSLKSGSAEHSGPRSNRGSTLVANKSVKTSKSGGGKQPLKHGKSRNKLAEVVRKSVTRYLKDLNGEEATGVYEMVLNEVEKPLLEVVMDYAEDNQSKASRILGINRNTLRKKLAQHQSGSGN